MLLTPDQSKLTSQAIMLSPMAKSSRQARDARTSTSASRISDAEIAGVTVEVRSASERGPRGPGAPGLFGAYQDDPASPSERDHDNDHAEIVSQSDVALVGSRRSQ